jgi:hypothetical protein
MPVSLNILNKKMFYINDSSANSALDVSYATLSNSVTGAASLPSSTITINSSSGIATGVNYSHICDVSINNTNFKSSGPYDIFELNQQLANRMNELMVALDVFQRCDRITRFVIGNTTVNPTNNYFTSNANTVNFNNDLSGCNAFDGTYLVQRPKDGISGNIFNGNVYGGNNVPSGLTDVTGVQKYPTFAANSSYSGTYGVTSGNPKKNLGQMIGDMDNLSKNYSDIISLILAKNATGFTKFDDNANIDTGVGSMDQKYSKEKIQSMFQQNLNLRQDLDQKVQAVLGAKGSYTYDSKLNQDSTIYANIMWSILATTLIYFVLVKM